jgi:ADP-ribose pyrophosphatase
MKGKRVALYGGSFDPPHLGHVITITAVLNSGLVDEIRLVPAGKHRDKGHYASPDDRKAMVSIMLSTMFGSRVPVYLEACEVNMPWVVSSSADLLRRMRGLYPADKFYLVIGSDLIRDIPGWKDGNFLMEKDNFLAVKRLGDDIERPVPPYLKLVDTERGALTNISSSLVREMIRKGESLEGIVPPAVIGHIIRNGLYADRNPKTATKGGKRTILEGRYLRFVEKNGWEFAERRNCSGVVGIIAVTSDGKMIFTEQMRIPIGKPVIEFPAGLVGDTAGGDEDALTAARRELEEETGYRASRWEETMEGPLSSGLTSEQIKFYLATGLKRRNPGGGDKSENITVHEIPIGKAEKWLRTMEKKGRAVDPKVYAGLYFVRNLI